MSRLDQAPPAAGVVKTIAGDGNPGIADGPARSATFLMPTALVRSPDGTLYITDEAAQRIRSLTPDGIVHTLAGSGPIAADGLSVKGDYNDGPALQARFNRPTGLALGPNGDLYVADSLNACIRKLAGGVVTTVAGVCGKSGAIDGPPPKARLLDPRSLAFYGNALYIADFGAGLRRLDADGRLSTIATRVADLDDKNLWGLALGEGGPGATIVASTPDRLLVYRPATNAVDWVGFYGEGNRPFGSPNQLAALDERQFLFTDLRSSVIRYMRLSAKPFVSTVLTRTLAGGPLERTVENAGFRDGRVSDSRFYAPRGIAVAGSVAYVADSGNRRIRAFGLPPLRVSETGFAGNAPYDSDHYQIVYLGASWTFWDSLGDDSICGRLEASLDATHRFEKRVRCHHARIDDATLPEMEDYIANYLTGHVDLIVVNANLPEVYSLFRKDESPTPKVAALAFRANMGALARRLQGSGTKLFLLWTFAADDVSDAENMYERDQPDHRKFPVDLSDNYADARSMMTSLAGLPIFQYDTHPDFLRYEQEAVLPPLYGTDDSHMTNAGSAFLAALLARAIEQQPGI